MRDHEKAQLSLDEHNFDEWEPLEDLPERTLVIGRLPMPDDYPEEYEPDPEFFMVDGHAVVPEEETLLYHATLLNFVPSILEDGILPRCKSLQAIWYPGEERVGYERLRECHTYMWNDQQMGLDQAMATVIEAGEGNLALLLVDTKNKLLEPDPEFNSDIKALEAEDADPVAVMHPAGIEKERIRCVCFLKEEELPTMGTTLVETDEIMIDQIREGILDMGKWQCRCRKGFRATR